MSQTKFLNSIIEPYIKFVENEYHSKSSAILLETYGVADSKLDDTSKTKTQKCIYQDEGKILSSLNGQNLILNLTNDLYLTSDVLNFSPQKITLESMGHDDKITCGLFIDNKSSVQKKYILIGTQLGKLYAIEKNFSKITSRIMINLDGQAILSLDIDSKLTVCTDKCILTFDEKFRPQKKFLISQEKGMHLKTYNISENDKYFIFEKEIYFKDTSDELKIDFRIKLPASISSVAFSKCMNFFVFLISNPINQMIDILFLEAESKKFIVELQITVDFKIDSKSVDINSSSEICLILNEKTYKLFKYQNISTPMQKIYESSNDISFQSKIADLTMLPKFDILFLRNYIQNNYKKLNLEEIFEFRDWTTEFKKTFFEIALDIDFHHMSLLHEKILEINVKSRKPNRKITLPLILKSNTIHIERALKLCRKYYALNESVYLCLKMGAYKEAFKEAFQESSNELMLDVLKNTVQHEEEFVSLFYQYLKNMQNVQDFHNIDDQFIELISIHPDPLQCFLLLPPKWLNNKKIVAAVVQIFNRYMLEISSLELFRNIQVQERLKALEERNQPGKRFNVKDDLCYICENKIIPQENTMSDVFFIRPMMVAFPNCGHMYHLSCIEFMKRSNQNLVCLKCCQK